MAVFRPIPPRLCLTAFAFTQPFLVRRVISYIENINTEDVSIGYSLLAAYGIVYLGIAVS
jgi:ATP-binding cassette subfamily C (CFTR/MRP) protein 1